MNTNPWSIKSVRVEGLLGSHDIHWSLHPKVNILGGRNGSGKSTILHALAIALDGIPQDDESDEEVTKHCKALFKSLTAELESGISLKIERDVSTRKEPIEDVELFGNSARKLKRVTQTISIQGTSSVPKDELSRHIAKHVIYINSADTTIRSISKLLEKSHNVGHPAVTALDLLLERALSTRNQLFAQRLMHEGNEDELLNQRKLFARFETAVRYFMQDYQIMDTSTLLFAPKHDKNIKISYDRLSTGEKQLLYILLTVCNTLGESTILLLDEADMGMHIDWKKNLLRELLNINPNMQILAATHSPSLIEGWYDDVREVSQLYTPAENKTKYIFS
jgi:hypothetical protein